jgi:N-hydroxyarylamine O-acetyltransferase
MFDLDAYIARVGLAGRPTIAELHRAHVATIPFENLDPHRGVPVSLELDAVQRKLVVERRGGYCFEHNLLHRAALQALGAEVEPMLARVRLGAPPGTVRAPTHLVLRVRAGGEEWLADVGFGTGGLLEPLPFVPDGGEYEQSGWRFQLVEHGHELLLRRAGADGWEDLYGFVPRAAPPLDIEMSNWFTSTHPQSAFVTGLLVSRQTGDGSRTTLSDWGELALIAHAPGARETTPVVREEIPRLLAERFGLPGFALDAAGRVVRAE